MNQQKQKNKFRQGVFIVTYAKTEKGIRYLILKRKLHWIGWEFVKGGLKSKEKIESAIKREVKEETGQFPLNIQDYNFSGKYLYEETLPDRNSFAGQTFSLYSAEIKKEKIKLDEKEHSDYLWVSFDETIKKLTWSNQKESLKIVDEFLKKLSKFRSIKTSSGKLIIAGKDAKTNEELISQVGKEEDVLHTEKPGSPFVNIKSSTTNDQDRKEAAIFCAAKSQDWRDNKSDVGVHIFKGKEISKSKGMKTGTFSVKKKKTIKVKKEDIKKWSQRQSN